MTLTTFLLLLALVLFVIAACGVQTGRFNAVAGGLACWVAATLVPLVS